MKVLRSSILPLLGLALCATHGALAQGVRTVYFWNGAGGSTTVKVGQWGNGTFVVQKDPGGGEQRLKVTPRGLYEGVRFDVNPPVDLAPYQAAGYVRLRVRFRESAAGPGPGGAPGTDIPTEGASPGGEAPPPPRGGNDFGFLISPRLKSGAATDEARSVADGRSVAEAKPTYGAAPALTTEAARPAPPRLAQFGNPDGGPFGGGPFGGGPFGGTGGGLDGGAPPQETEISIIQLTLVLDKGVAVGKVNIDLTKSKMDDEGWHFFLLPVKNMLFTPDAGTLIKRLLVTSDKQDVFTLGEAAITIEGGDMSVSIRRPTDPSGTQQAEISVKPGPMTLVADVEAGAADPIVEWNFDADNKGAPQLQDTGTTGDTGIAVRQGPRVDARGQQAKFEYPNEEQDYRVEVTVRDRSGKKKPVKASMLVHVRG